MIIEDLFIDSRKVIKGSAFIAIKGSQADGHDYISKAIENGAAVLFVDNDYEGVFDNVTMVAFEDTRKIAGLLAKKFFDNPSDHLKVIAITGTNGKTSVAWMVYDALQKLSENVGLISTIDARIGDEVIPSSLTTPDVITMQRLLAKMVLAQCDYVVMEASSHALDQGRLEGVDVDIATFTNLTRDHLDYHGDMLSYLRCKKRLFDDLSSESVALFNADDKNGKVMVQDTKARVRAFGVRTMSDYRARLRSMDMNGMELEMDNATLFSRVIGEFNVYNLLAVYAILIELEMDREEALKALSLVQAPEGRLDVVRDPQGVAKAVIDYAHTPDAVKNVLKVVRDIIGAQSKVITVIGAGGDRDKGKRPLMAKVAFSGSDKVIFTSDNPRSEDPEQIIQEMLAGLSREEEKKVFSITDRREAIKMACALGKGGDIVLIVGKGHEKYQEVNGVKVPFDDKVEVYNFII